MRNVFANNIFLVKSLDDQNVLVSGTPLCEAVKVFVQQDFA